MFRENVFQKTVSYFLYCRDNCCVANYDAYYYMIVAPLYLSWTEAQGLCKLMDSNLPSITSYWDMVLLEGFLSHRLTPLHRSLDMKGCRFWDPLCMVFIGLNTSQVYK